MKTWNGTALVDVFVEVTGVSDQTTFYRYTVTLRSGTSETIPAKTAVVSYGDSTNGGAILLSGEGANTPYIDVFTTGATPWTGVTPRVRIGCLAGIAGQSGWGLWTCNVTIGGTVSVRETGVDEHLYLQDTGLAGNAACVVVRGFDCNDAQAWSMGQYGNTGFLWMNFADNLYFGTSNSKRMCLTNTFTTIYQRTNIGTSGSDCAAAVCRLAFAAAVATSDDVRLAQA